MTFEKRQLQNRGQIKAILKKSGSKGCFDIRIEEKNIYYIINYNIYG